MFSGLNAEDTKRAKREVKGLIAAREIEAHEEVRRLNRNGKLTLDKLTEIYKKGDLATSSYNYYRNVFKKRERELFDQKEKKQRQLTFAQEKKEKQRKQQLKTSAGKIIFIYIQIKITKR